MSDRLRRDLLRGAGAALILPRAGRAATSPDARAPAPLPSASAQAPSPSGLVLPTATGLSVLDPRYQRLYGPGTTVIDRLAFNYVRRRSDGDYVMAQRFRAPLSGSIQGLRFYAPEGPEGDYAAGTGGRLRLRVVRDDGSLAHLPDATANAVATGDFIPDMRAGRYASRGNQFPLIAMTATSDIHEGDLYHVVYEQIDALPDANFVNINSTATNEVAGRPRRWADTLDWASLYGVRAMGATGGYRWSDASQSPYGGLFYVPILQVTLASGRSFGSSVMESGNVEGREWAIGSESAVRERFFPTTTRRIVGVSFQTGCDGPGALQWRFSSAGKDLAQGVVREAAATYRFIQSHVYRQGVFRWYDVAFETPVDMLAGQVHELAFQPQGESRWHFAVQRNGCSWGFGYPAAFSESQAQHRLDGRWTAAYMWDHARITSDTSNWRVVLQTS